MRCSFCTLILTDTCHIGKTWASHLRRLHQPQSNHDDYDDDLNDDMNIERKIAEEIMTIVNTRGLPFILDRLTEGRGNCFPIAILDQCKRPEIINELSVSMKTIVKQKRDRGQLQLRHEVEIFIQTSKHPNVAKFKAEYQNSVALASQDYWDEYWARIVQDKVWADYTFVQSTAWYLKHDILIVNTTNTEENPIIVISGNLNNENEACPGAMITLGSKSNSHFQSLLPIEYFHMNSIHSPSNMIQESNTADKVELEIKAIKLNLSAESEPKLVKYQDCTSLM